MTRVGDTDETATPVFTSTVRSASAFAAYSRSFGLNIGKSSGPASTSVIRASSWLDVSVVAGEVTAVELGDGACRLDSGRAPAHDDDVEGAVRDEARIAVRGLPPLEDVILEPDCVGERVHREGVLDRALGAEEVDLGAEAEDEVVVRDRRHALEADLPRFEVDPGHGRLVDRRVVVAREQVTQRVADSARVEQAGGELVEQRLEGVVVVPVDEHDLGVRVLQLLRRADPGEPATEDQDPRACRTGAHDGVIPQTVVIDCPGSRRITESPVRKAFGGQVIGSTARLRRFTSGRVSPVKSIR